MESKFSGNNNDSGRILANIRNKNLKSSKTPVPSTSGKIIMKEFLTYNAVNFDAKLNRKKYSSKSREKYSN